MANSYLEKERICEYEFNRGGEYWHLCTPGQITEIIFKEIMDYKFGITNTAICSVECNLKIISDAIMSNHIHFIIEGHQVECLNFFSKYRKRLKRYFTNKEVIVDLSHFNCNIFPITNIQSMRNEIVYVNRNGYLVNEKYTPFSYPWGSGYLYFNDGAQLRRGIPFNKCQYELKRKIIHGRIPDLSDKYVVDDDMILPVSYCNFFAGQSFFRDAHHYMKMITRNAESYGEIAKRLGDNIFLTDNEIYTAITQISLKEYGIKQPSLLPPQVKLELAKKMSFEYHASNSQIRRILNLDLKIINELFPLKSN
jgi:REP element-mobilizing transposase RayT